VKKLGDYNQGVKVGIADCKVAHSPRKIITLGLGSCVGITLYDPKLKLGGMAHIMLPDSTQFAQVSNPLKFADLAIPELVSRLKSKGANISALQAKIAGGAQMFAFLGSHNKTLNIGERNVNKAREVLKQTGIPVQAAEVGGSIGRTMILDTETGKVFIRSVGYPIKEL